MPAGQCPEPGACALLAKGEFVACIGRTREAARSLLFGATGMNARTASRRRAARAAGKKKRRAEARR